MNDNRELAERCFYATVRVERIVHLATMASDDSIDSDLAEWLEDDCAELLTEVLGHPLGEVVSQYGPGNSRRREALLEALVDKPALGWIIEMATPTMTPNADNTSASFSWGQYRMRAFYGESYEEALEKGFAWAQSTHPVLVPFRPTEA